MGHSEEELKAMGCDLSSIVVYIKGTEDIEGVPEFLGETVNVSLVGDN